MTSPYDPQHVSGHFDAYGEREWDRLEADPPARVSFHIHRWFLQQYIDAGMHVLEAGAGPGRFTIELARLGARVTVGDLSPTQLALNATKVRDAGWERSIVAREVLDIVDLSRFPTAAFDATVCYGGPLSYVLDRAGDAVAELLRVTRPGGHLLVSVMSLLGTMRRFLPGILEEIDQYGLPAVQHVQRTGDLTGDLARGHTMHLYRWSELKALLERYPCTVVAAAASNFLSVRNEEALQPLWNDPERRNVLLAWELAACREAGAVDGGTHIIAVARRH